MSIFSPFLITNINDDFYIVRDASAGNHTIAISPINDTFGDITYPPPPFSPPAPPPFPPPPPSTVINVNATLDTKNIERIGFITSTRCALRLRIPVKTSPSGFENIINGTIEFNDGFEGQVNFGVVEVIIDINRQNFLQNNSYTLIALNSNLRSSSNIEVNFLDRNKTIIQNEVIECPGFE